MGQISQTFIGCGKNLTKFLWEWLGLVQLIPGKLWWVKYSLRLGEIWSEFLQKQCALVKFSPGVVGIKLTFSKSGWDQLNFLLQRVGLVQHPGVDRIGQILSGSNLDWSKFLSNGMDWGFKRVRDWLTSPGLGGIWSEFLQEQCGLVKLSLGVGSIGQTFTRSCWDWSNFLQEWVGLLKFSLWVGGIDQNSFTSCQEWPKFLWEQAELVKNPSRAGRSGI